MALVATVGAATANSYVTRLEANAYFQLGVHPKSETWHLLDDGDKDQFLVRATRTVDMQRINGTKYDTSTTSGVPDQALKFPRTVDYDSGIFIPAPVKEATYEQAIFDAEAGTGSDTRTRLQAQGVKSISIAGDISETYETSGRSTVALLCPRARALLVGGGFIKRTGAIAV